MIWFTFKLNFFFGALVLLFCAKDLVEWAKLTVDEQVGKLGLTVPLTLHGRAD